MNNNEQEFKKRLLATFKAEASDHLRTISAGLYELEKSPPVEVQTEIVETIFRDSHSLKGAARAVNSSEIEAICRAFEGIFAAWKKNGVRRLEGLFDTLYLTIDAVKSILSTIDTGENALEKGLFSMVTGELASYEVKLSSAPDIHREEVIYLDQTPEPRIIEPMPPSAKDAFAAKRRILADTPLSEDTVRVSTAKLGSLLAQAEELLTAKTAAALLTSNLIELSTLADTASQKHEQGRYEAPSMRMERPAGRRRTSDRHLDEAAEAVEALKNRLSAIIKSSANESMAINKMVDGLLEDAKKTMMLPFSALFEPIPMIVRDLAREQMKEVDLVISGESTEVDRRVLEEMKDPLIHLVRNAIDHGITRPIDRRKKNKPERANISIKVATASGNRVKLDISDDGAGIDLAKVKQSAVREGFLSAEEASKLSDDETLQLVFRSSVTTSDIITDISGRGLGLAIVREKAERLGGSVEVQTSGSGTLFTIDLPVTVATFRGIMVTAGGQDFILPTANVEKSIRARQDDIKTVENRRTVTFQGRPVPFVPLQDIMNLPRKKKLEEKIFSQALIVDSLGRYVAIGVDEIKNEQEVLVKGLGRQLARVRNISGTALLESGRLVLILNPADLVRSAAKASGAPVAAATTEAATEKKTVLVVEDSITSRVLIKNILESAGYIVKTSVDGIEGLTLLKTEPFDLVVSDIEMPRMDGFELTKRIRADTRLSELPVILVTALETREDREQGIEAGANAYIIKSSFDQSNLLEVAKRLL